MNIFSVILNIGLLSVRKEKEICVSTDAYSQLKFSGI